MPAGSSSRCGAAPGLSAKRLESINAGVKILKVWRWGRLLLPLFLAVSAGAISTAIAAAPIVTITSPANGSILAAPASFTIRASVSGGGNNVSQIEFFNGTSSLGVDTSNPYRVDVNNLPAGTYTLTAILTDNGG